MAKKCGFIRKFFGMCHKTTWHRWNVYLRGKKIDSVSYTADMAPSLVKRTLIEHDGYDPRITIKKVSRK